MSRILRQYFQSIKPGVILGNLVSVFGGFFLASKGKNVNYTLLIFTISGVSLLISSACMFNNYIDKDIDKKMERTKDRLLIKTQIHPGWFLICATLLGLFGFFLLQFYVSTTVFYLGIIGFLIYVGIYSIYMKRYSVYSTLIGSISGAIPPVIGYCAVTNTFDIGALILSTIFIFWQIPHSYSIQILWLQDYQVVNIPVLPVLKGILVTKKYIIFCIAMFAFSTVILTLKGYMNYKCLTISLIESLWWFGTALHGYKTRNDKIWARNLFVFSVFIITSFSMMISIDFLW